MKTLQDLFLEQLGDIYDAEIRLAKALPKMAKAATEEELKAAFQSHFKETEGHLKTVERIFDAFGEKAKGKKCEAIIGLIDEAEQMASDHEDSPTINAALICAAQKAEHYEIATYGCLREWAELLGRDDAVDQLEEILGEEKSADDKLTELARAHANPEGNQPEEEEGMLASRRGGTRHRAPSHVARSKH